MERGVVVSLQFKLSERSFIASPETGNQRTGALPSSKSTGRSGRQENGCPRATSGTNCSFSDQGQRSMLSMTQVCTSKGKLVWVVLGGSYPVEVLEGGLIPEGLAPECPGGGEES